jgi:hypothetical protein
MSSHPPIGLASQWTSWQEEHRTQVRRRIGEVGLLMGGISVAFLFQRLLVGLLDPATQPDFWRLAFVGHVGGAAFTLALYPGARALPDRALMGMEAACYALAAVSYAGMATEIPLIARPDVVLLLIFGTLLVARAIHVPSRWQDTAVLAGVLYAILLGASASIYLSALDEGFAEAYGAAIEAAPAGWHGQARPSLAQLRLYPLIETSLWFLAFAIIAGRTSAVHYGLAAEVGKTRRLGQYTLERKLGEGGMGAVYVARHALLRRSTAVKLILPERVGEEAIERFEREVRATARLNHPNTITIFDYGRTQDGVFYYAMELIDGSTMRRLVELEGAVDPRRVVFFLVQIADALAEAHGAGLVHRDLKPDNLMISERGGVPDSVTVVDFGLVKEVGSPTGAPEVTATGAIVGTPQYLAPETIEDSGSADARTDLYAVGAVAYYLLTGTPVFQGKSVVEICSHHLLTVPEPPSARLGKRVDPGLEAIVLACLEKKPADRPASADALRRRLEALEMVPWTREEARAWWAEMGPDLREAVAAPTGTSSRTLALDLGRRS